MKKNGYWRCKKHKESCKSYVTFVVDKLNNGEKVKKEYMTLVEFVKK